MTGNYLFKLIIAGSGGSGKTTLLRRYTTGLFSGSTKMTIGVDFSVTQCKTSKDQNVTLQIWDFGGENRFRSLLPSFCLGASGCLMLFDPLRPATFHELEEWVDIVQSNTKNIPILLLSSKHDLIDEGHPFSVANSDIEAFVEKHKLAGYIHVSSKTGLNVAQSFTKISELMIEKNAG
ncbi:MAG: GTP-binding protein [Candidatus Lokiarchaeota archaeon]|nr:GTP-binding protein [Candidatus Harpocratesius repetitus]